ncbi:glycosyl hydrolase family 28-related protein [Roseococcus microcysteis]|uniref:glycosyl hydrolase family 28-related protein n=1 Tax=Roseococcus microcysteis TaxID=2771361 RepID=UPI00168B99C4|nr:glycosyl hydrolase family 28-related protein [Roseococcus microcysteis]
MPDLKISELPAATTLNDADITALVQPSPNTTRRATMGQLRRQLLTDRGVDVRDFGAVGNGVANDAPAIQAAINALGSAGGVVNLGARTYRLASAIVVNSGAIRLVGQGFNEGGSPGAGTWLTVDQTNFTPFTFSTTAARGSAVVNLAVRQTHSAAQDASWAPTAYDWFFRVENCLGGVDFDNILLSGINRGIFIRNSGRADLRRIRGQVFTAGIEIDESFDTARLMNIHFWPFWSANNNVVRWQQNNGDAMIFRRVDGIFIDQSFVLGYRTMFRFSSSAAGFTQKFSIGQAYADFVRHGVLVEANGTDGQIDSMTVQCELFNAAGAPLPGSVGIMLNANSSRIQIANLRVDDAEDNAIRLEQHSNRLDIGALRVVNFNLRANGASAIHLVNATTGVPNRVNLGSNPLLQTAVMGPLFNAGTNGSVGVLGPAGETARPGIAVGEAGTGLSMPTPGVLAVSRAGVEVLRADGTSVSLGAAPGSHGLEVLTPSGSINRMQAQGGPTGTPGRVGWIASGADANIDVVVGQAKGSGALLAQFPDGATTGGNARGAQSVDLQVSRTAAAQVASGANSTISGGSNNTASGTNSVVAGGISNAATGTNSSIGGGNTNQTGSAGAWVPGGERANTRNILGRGAWASGRFSSEGDAQAGEHVLRQLTTDAVPARVTANASAATGVNSANLPNNATYRIKALVVAQQTGGSAGTVGDCASWEVNLLVKRGANAAATSFVGGQTTTTAPALASIVAGTPFAPGLRDAGAANWRLTVSADTSFGGPDFTVTGEANKTIRWVARIMSVEVSV